MQTPTAQSSRSDSATATLRRQILSGTAPAGELLAESAVARRLGVSRATVYRVIKQPGTVRNP